MRTVKKKGRKAGPAATQRSIAVLLASSRKTEIRRGLRLAAKRIAEGDQREVRSLFEMVSAVFYIDPLDRPDLAPLLDEAMAVVVSFGPRAIPLLMKELGSGDVKAEMVAAKALGNMGAEAVDPLIEAYRGTRDPILRSFVLLALGKIEEPDVLRAVPLALESARSKDLDLRDTATRALGNFAEAIPPGKIPKTLRGRIVERLQKNLADTNPGVRAKTVRSLGKLDANGHLTEEEGARLEATCSLLLGKDENFAWDRAYLVRKEAEEVLARLRRGKRAHGPAAR
jgi:hypothetical protein